MGVYLVWESSQKGDYRVYMNLEQAAMRAEELSGTVYEIMPAGDARLFFIEDIASGDIEVQRDVRLAAIAAIQEGRNLNLSPAAMLAVSNVFAPTERDKQTCIGVSEIGDDCERCIADKLLGIPHDTENTGTPLAPFLGTAFHAFAESRTKTSRTF